MPLHSLLLVPILAAGAVPTLVAGELEQARDRQDRSTLVRMIEERRQAAGAKPNDAAAHYDLALALSYLAEVAQEQGDKPQVREAAQAGVRAAERAVNIDSRSAEYQRILGTLCGQLIPADLLLALSYGRRARDSLERAVELDPQSPRAWVSHGVGNYYLPEAFGGGMNAAIADFRKAVDLDPKVAEAHLWLGVALRKQGLIAEARKSLETAVALNPNRVWARQQLEKTPAK